MKKDDIINGCCHTNRDNFDVSMVKGFARVPNIGEKIACKYNGKDASLKVVQITHDVADGEPFLVIELNL